MEREILFRGKRLDTVEWVEGFYTRYSPSFVGDVIETGGDDYIVDPATVGQYTGLTDKNGQKIFVGDIMSFGAYRYDYIGIVSFINGSFCIYCDDSIVPFLHYAIERYGAEVIGNIYDNPEILEVQNGTAN